ncbi:MAG: HAD hydrolase family protein [Promethearchaeota archaeon]|jgi:energy-converting hydrogenase A subunit R
MSKKNVCCWDLEGPISILDFAAEIGKLLSEKSILNLKNYDMGEFFRMISNYDDYIIDEPGVKDRLKIPEYQPGDTLRIMAPLYTACYTDSELIHLAKNNLGLLPGCRELMKILHKDWEIFVISTSYSQFAYNVTDALNITRDHVYCTEMNIKKLREGVHNIEGDVEVLLRDIFQKYLKNNKNLNIVINDLNNFFWMGKNSDYIKVMNQVIVRGGKRKENAVEEISQKTGVSISEMIALGDSITDINMLQRLKDDFGIAVSFNGNRFSLKRANVAVTTPNSLGVLPIFESANNLSQFLEEWEQKFTTFHNDPINISKNLISKESKGFFVKYKFIPEYANLTNKTEKQLNEITSKQELMRKKVRGWAGNLG